MYLLRVELTGLATLAPTMQQSAACWQKVFAAKLFNPDGPKGGICQKLEIWFLKGLDCFVTLLGKKFQSNKRPIIEHSSIKQRGSMESPHQSPRIIQAVTALMMKMIMIIAALWIESDFYTWLMVDACLSFCDAYCFNVPLQLTYRLNRPMYYKVAHIHNFFPNYSDLALSYISSVKSPIFRNNVKIGDNFLNYSQCGQRGPA